MSEVIDRWDIAEGIEDGLVYRPETGSLVEYADYEREISALRGELAVKEAAYQTALESWKRSDIREGTLQFNLKAAEHALAELRACLDKIKEMNK